MVMEIILVFWILLISIKLPKQPIWPNIMPEYLFFILDNMKMLSIIYLSFTAMI